MDADWKLTIFMHTLLCDSQDEQEIIIAKLAQEVIMCSLQANKSIEMMTFAFRYVQGMLEKTKGESKTAKLTEMSGIVKCGLFNMMRLDQVKKVPIYDQHLQKPAEDPSLTRITSDIYVPLFQAVS